MKKNTDILNDENFKLVQRTLALNELEAEIKKYHISILDFQKKNSEIIEEIPKITEKDLVLQSEIQNLSTEIFEIQAKNLKSQKKILKTSKEVATYEDSLPALTVNYNNLLEEVSELSKKIGKLHSELFETIAKSTSSTLCTVCNGPEAGRMKKCIICGVSVHARCTKETKFTCEVCKAL